MPNKERFEVADLSHRCDWLENQLGIISEYEQIQADEITSLKEVIRKLFESNEALYELVKELSCDLAQGLNHA